MKKVDIPNKGFKEKGGEGDLFIKLELEEAETKNKKNEEVIKSLKIVIQGLEKDIEVRENEIKELSNKLKQLSDELNIQKKNTYDLKQNSEFGLSQLNKAREKISKLNQEINDLKDQVCSLQNYKKRNEELEEENSHLKKKIEEDNKLITKLKKEVENKENNSSIQILGISDIDKFEKVQRIGKGYTSEVFEAIEQVKRAIKVLDIDVNLNNQGEKKGDSNSNAEIKVGIEKLRQFIQECEVINSLNHPNIIKTYGFFCGDKTHQPSIVREYCESNLKRKIKELNDEERIQLIIDVSSAMNKVHSIGIVHRDLKLENILLDSKNIAKISDFGICTFIKNDDKELSHSQMEGSFKFMAPELLQGRSDYNEKVDVYSFGTIVFIILTKGEYPKISFDEVVIGKQAPIPDSISKFSSQIIIDCWSFDSNDRPTSKEICDRLKGNGNKLI